MQELGSRKLDKMDVLNTLNELVGVKGATDAKEEEYEGILQVILGEDFMKQLSEEEGKVVEDFLSELRLSYLSSN